MHVSYEELRRIVKGYVLKNAVKHGGKASVGPVMSMILGEHPELRSRAKELVEIVKDIVSEVNSLPLERQEQILREEYPELLVEERKTEEKKALPPLPAADKYKVIVTRFAPNPDFDIHLGNARPAIISHEYARIYKGKFILRFEDTDPRIKTPLPEAYNIIKENLAWLGIKWDEEYIQSLRMEIYYEIARELLSKNAAYIDMCSREEFSRYRNSGKPCPHRNASVEDNLELWDKMLEGYFNEGEAVFRLKTDLLYPDPSVRDWVAMRIIDTDRSPHPLTGSRYIVWPTYNFAAAVDDHLLGITHILRGKEHLTNTIKQKFLYKHLGWKYPETLHLGRLKLEGFIMSKSKIRKMLEDYPDKFHGISDIRFGTLSALRNRGFEPEAIKKIILEVGVKTTDASISFDNLASVNRKLIDPVTPRLIFVPNPVKLLLRNLEECVEAEIPFHPSNENLGSRKLSICPDKPEIYVSANDVLMKRELRLMELANIALKNKNNDFIEAEITDFSLEYARRKRLTIIQWLPVKDALRAVVVKPIGLRLKRDKGYVEPSITKYKIGDKFQFYRYGFVTLKEKTGKKHILAFIHE